MITLKEAKNYLRVDYEEDDKLIQNLLYHLCLIYYTDIKMSAHIHFLNCTG